MKIVSIISMFLVLLMVSSLSADEVSKISAVTGAVDLDRVIIPISLENTQDMAALDLPLKFTDGVTLEEVSFEGTRSETFDFAAAKIDNDANTVVIGLLPMVFGENADLEPGNGEIAKLIFSVDDKSLESIELSTISIKGHEPMFVRTEMVDGQAHTVVATPEFSGITVALIASDANDQMPTSFALRQNYPNPFNPQTSIAFDLPAASHVTLEILNVLGQKVKTLVSEYREAGSHSVIWDGTSDNGSTTASGVYFYRLNADGNQAVKKMMMLK
jgi:hypothetical protein